MENYQKYLGITKKKEHLIMKNNFESKFFKIFLVAPQIAHLVSNKRNKGQTLVTLDNRSSGVKELIDYKIK